jgi:hypothetical protein
MASIQNTFDILNARRFAIHAETRNTTTARTDSYNPYAERVSASLQRWFTDFSLFWATLTVDLRLQFKNFYRFHANFRSTMDGIEQDITTLYNDHRNRIGSTGDSSSELVAEVTLKESLNRWMDVHRRFGDYFITWRSFTTQITRGTSNTLFQYFTIPANATHFSVSFRIKVIGSLTVALSKQSPPADITSDNIVNRDNTYTFRNIPVTGSRSIQLAFSDNGADVTITRPITVDAFYLCPAETDSRTNISFPAASKDVFSSVPLLVNGTCPNGHIYSAPVTRECTVTGWRNQTANTCFPTNNTQPPHPSPSASTSPHSPSPEEETTQETTAPTEATTASTEPECPELVCNVTCPGAPQPGDPTAPPTVAIDKAPFSTTPLVGGAIGVLAVAVALTALIIIRSNRKSSAKISSPMPLSHMPLSVRVVGQSLE